MTPEEFLRAVWPSEGVYCLAFPWRTPEGTPTFSHKTFDTIEEVLACVEQEKGRRDVYFTMFTLKEHEVYNERKQKTQVRTIANTAEAQCFFCEIDVGEGGHFKKYADQKAALRDLHRFCKATGLPRPVVTSSGRGLHVFWPLSESLPTANWRPFARKLHALMSHHELNVDPSKITDPSAVLRVPGTFHLKDRNNPKPVTILVQGSASPTDDFLKWIDDAISRSGVAPKGPLEFPTEENHGWDDNTTQKYDGPPVSFGAVLKTCRQLQKVAVTRGNVPEPIWFKVLLATAVHCEKSDEVAHAMSQGHPNYTREETDARLARLRDGEFGPPLCTTIAAECGESGCDGCPVLKSKFTSPVTAARFHDPAAAPVVKLAAGPEMIERTLIDPPPPYIRLKDGRGIGATLKDKKGEEYEAIILPYDLYPVSRLVNLMDKTEQQMWRVHLPRSEPKDFIIEPSDLYDQRALLTAISKQGIYPSPSHAKHLGEYMSAYVRELQAMVDAEPQADHFGWDSQLTKFVLPDRVLNRDGTVTPVTLTRNARAIADDLKTAGTLEKQVALLKFYDHPSYIAHQYFIMQSLASPLFFATDQHGIIVNALGDPGASKSSSLYTAASFWGHPQQLSIAGTQGGITPKARLERISTMANLPMCMDEITNIPDKEAKQFALAISQPTGTIRLDATAKEKPKRDTYKSSITMTTSNKGLHQLLASDNAAGTAASMRVFEIQFRLMGIHQKHEADAFLRELKKNYGHIGPTFMTHVMKDIDEVIAKIEVEMRYIDQVCKIGPGERFWSADAATTIVVTKLANSLGLVPFNADALRNWVIKVQIPHMRNVVHEEYTDPFTMLTNYIESIHAGIIITKSMDHDRSKFLDVLKHPMGPLLAHADRDAGILWVRIDAFKEYCQKRGASATELIQKLHQPVDGGRIISYPNRRRTLGAGTNHAKGQSYVFGVDLTHPLVSGVAQLVEVEKEDAA